MCSIFVRCEKHLRKMAHIFAAALSLARPLPRCLASNTDPRQARHTRRPRTVFAFARLRRWKITRALLEPSRRSDGQERQRHTWPSTSATTATEPRRSSGPVDRCGCWRFSPPTTVGARSPACRQPNPWRPEPPSAVRHPGLLPQARKDRTALPLRVDRVRSVLLSLLTHAL